MKESDELAITESLINCHKEALQVMKSTDGFSYSSRRLMENAITTQQMRLDELKNKTRERRLNPRRSGD